MFDLFFHSIVGRHAYWWEWLIIAATLVAALCFLSYWLLDKFGGMDP